MMNLTSFEHAAFAVAIQIAIGLLSGDWWAGAAAGAFFFVGREHAQAEYRYISAFGGGRRINMPWWGGFDRRVWTKLDAWLDWLVPCVAVLGVALYIGS